MQAAPKLGLDNEEREPKKEPMGVLVKDTITLDILFLLNFFFFSICRNNFFY